MKTKWPRFSNAGLDSVSIQAQKLWQASRELKVLPHLLLDTPELWVDWIVEMGRKYPDPIKFVRRSEQEEKRVFTNAAVKWTDVLLGSSLQDFYGKFISGSLKAKLRATDKHKFNNLPTR